MNFIREWIRTIHQYQRSVKFILLWNLLFCLGLSIYLVLYNLYLKQVIPGSSIGPIVGISYVAYAILSVVSGMLADRYGTKRTLLFGLFFLSTGFCGAAYAESMVSLSCWAVVTGLGQAFTNVIFVPLLTEHSREQERMKLFSAAFGSGTFFLFLGTFVGGYLTDKLTNGWNLTSLQGIRITLLLAATCLVISAIPLFLVKEGSKQEIKGSARSKQGKGDKKDIWLMGNYGGAKLMEGFGIGLVLPFINLFLADRYLLKPSMISAVMAIAALGTVIIMLVNPSITKKWGEQKTLFLYQTIGLPCMMVMGFVVSLPAAAVCLLMFRSTFYSMMPIQSKLMMERVGPSVKGVTNSIGFMTTTIGTGLGSLVYMPILAAFGAYWGYVLLYFVAAVSIASSVLYFSWLCARCDRQVKENPEKRQIA